jgi:hypothetical protein
MNGLLERLAVAAHELPELLTTLDGRTIENSTDWQSIRRPAKPPLTACR